MDFVEVEKILAMRKAFRNLSKRVERRRKEFEDLCAEIRNVREMCVGNEELLRETIENLEKNGFVVFEASSGDEAYEIIKREIDDQVVVKSKSNACREIGIEKLAEDGVEVIETDVGDRILQLLGESPSHPTGPASHLSASVIAAKLSEVLGIDVPADPQRIARIVRADIERRAAEARIGISGANAMCREGSLLVLHNEGNISDVIRKEKWIAVVGLEKVYPSIADAVKAAKLQSFFATGRDLPSFIEIVAGNAVTADIEKTPVRIDSRETVVVILDNGRRELIKRGFAELLYCIECGSCVANCPAHIVHRNAYAGGRFSLLNALKDDSKELRLCLRCGRCKKACPLSIDIPEMIDRLEPPLRRFVYSHLALIATLADFALSWTYYNLKKF